MGGIKMKVDAEIQQKVVTLCGAKVSNGLKIAVRERFYQLKVKEIEIEKAAEQFRIQQLKNEKEFGEEVKEYSIQLDGLLKQSRTATAEKPQVKSVMAQQIDTASQLPEEEPVFEAATEEEYFSEPQPEVPQIKQTSSAGVKVRMQEVIEDNSEGISDEDVPIEFVEGDGQR